MSASRTEQGSPPRAGDCCRQEHPPPPSTPPHVYSAAASPCWPPRPAAPPSLPSPCAAPSLWATLAQAKHKPPACVVMLGHERHLHSATCTQIRQPALYMRASPTCHTSHLSSPAGLVRAATPPRVAISCATSGTASQHQAPGDSNLLRQFLTHVLQALVPRPRVVIF